MGMKNVEMVRQGNSLVIKVDLGKRFGASGSGKSLTVATTSGIESIGDGYKVGLNVFVSNPDYSPDGEEVVVTTSSKGKGKRS